MCEVGATRAVAELDVHVQRREDAVGMQMGLVDPERAERVQQAPEVAVGNRVLDELELQRQVT